MRKIASSKAKKMLIIIFIFSSVLVAAWQLGAGDYFMARLIFAPDREDLGEQRQEEIRKDRDEEITRHEGEGRYSSEQIPPLDYTVTVVAEELEIPWEILPLPDGRLLVTERPGRVTIVGG